MRPCQRCGTAILPKQADCPLCGHRQMFIAGQVEEFEEDADIVAQQEKIQEETETIIQRIAVTTMSSVLCLLMLLGYASGGIGGAVYAGLFFLIAVLLGLGIGVDFGG